MRIDGHVYLRVNKHYVATVRNLADLEHYLKNVNDSDESFGEITDVLNVTDGFLSALHRMIRRHKKVINGRQIGRTISVYRNQGYRSAVVIAVSPDKFLLSYAMPSGAVYYNVVDSLDSPDRYKSITRARAIHSDAFGDQLKKVR